MDAKAPRLVAGRGHDAPPFGPAAHDQRDARVFGMVQEMHVDEEGVHVQVQDGPLPGNLIGVLHVNRILVVPALTLADCPRKFDRTPLSDRASALSGEVG